MEFSISVMCGGILIVPDANCSGVKSVDAAPGGYVMATVFGWF